MHVFMTFIATVPRGGLHAHVETLVRVLLANGHECTVMCRPCPSVSVFRSLGATVLETSFEDLAESVNTAVQNAPYDLVHAHPYHSRRVGVAVASQLHLPLMVTMHGMLTDNVQNWGADVGLLVCVSHAVRDSMVSVEPCVASRAMVVPNGVDTSLFQPGAESLDEVIEDLTVQGAPPVRPKGPLVLLVSRFHRDKAFIVDCVEELLCASDEIEKVGATFWVVGEGELEPRLREVARNLEARLGRRAVSFLGWQDLGMLARLYRCADLAIAPGRSVLEAMSCETPVIAIGSKHYSGLQTTDTILPSAHTNFGGVGAKHEGYKTGRIVVDFLEGLNLRGDASLRNAYRTLIDWHYDEKRVEEQILFAHEMARLQPPAREPADAALRASVRDLIVSRGLSLDDAKVCMLRAKDYSRDGRARKQAATLVEAGAKLTMIGVGTQAPDDLLFAGYDIRILPARLPSVLPRLGREQVWWPLRVAVNLTYTRCAEKWVKWRAARMVYPYEDALVEGALEVRPDVVHAYNVQTLSAAIRVKRETGARVVYDSLDQYTDIAAIEPSKRRLYGRIEARLLDDVDAILVVSEPRADILESRYSVARPTVVYLGPAEVMGSVNPVQSPVRMLFQGAFSADRNLASLIDAMPALRGKALLSLQGFGGIDSELREQVLSLGLEEDVVFLPPVAPLDVVKSASQHDVGIICHRGESLNHSSTVPNKLMDYLGAGLALAVSDLPGHRSVLEGTGAAVFIDPSSAETLTRDLLALVEHPERITEMKAAALRTARGYEWPVQAAKLLTVYRSVLGETP